MSAFRPVIGPSRMVVLVGATVTVALLAPVPSSFQAVGVLVHVLGVLATVALAVVLVGRPTDVGLAGGLLLAQLLACVLALPLLLVLEGAFAVAYALARGTAVGVLAWRTGSSAADRHAFVEALLSAD